MSICGEAEAKDTPDAYKVMYRAYSNMSYSDANDLIADALGMLETKLLLNMDNAGLTKNEKLALLNKAREIPELLLNAEAVISAHLKFRAGTSTEEDLIKKD